MKICIYPFFFLRIAGIYVLAGSDLGLDGQKNDVNAQKMEVESWFAHPSYNPDMEASDSNEYNAEIHIDLSEIPHVYDINEP